MSNIAAIETRASLLKNFSKLTDDKLVQLAIKLTYCKEGESLSSSSDNDVQMESSSSSSAKQGMTRELLTEVLVSHFEKRVSQLDEINLQPLYPDEVD